MTGEILENTQPLIPRQFKRRFSFVPQEDELWAVLTIRQLLTYTALLRFNDKSLEITKVSIYCRSQFVCSLLVLTH